MKFLISLIVLIINIIFPSNVYSLSGEEAIENFLKRISEIKTMKGEIAISCQSGIRYTGVFKYMHPGKILIKFSNPSGKSICTNGKSLWIYDATSNICGVQVLDMESPFVIEALLSSYTSLLMAEGPSGYKVNLRGTTEQYSEITITLDSLFLLKEAIFISEEGQGFVLSVSNLILDEKMIPGIFDFNIPSNAQTVKNPLDVR